jgi:hypothetical protein
MVLVLCKRKPGEHRPFNPAMDKRNELKQCKSVCDCGSRTVVEFRLFLKVRAVLEKALQMSFTMVLNNQAGAT